MPEILINIFHLQVNAHKISSFVKAEVISHLHKVKKQGDKS